LSSVFYNLSRSVLDNMAVSPAPTYLTNFSLRRSLSTLNSLAGTVNTELWKIVGKRK